MVLGFPEDALAGVAAAAAWADANSQENCDKTINVPMKYNNFVGNLLTIKADYWVRMPILLSRMA